MMAVFMLSFSVVFCSGEGREGLLYFLIECEGYWVPGERMGRGGEG
jgi:hypothetical protein